MVMPPVKSSPAKLFNMKALIIAVLIALSAASVVIAGLFRGDVMVNAKDSVKRFLRSHADTTGSDQADISEERGSPGTSLESALQNLQLGWGRLAQRSLSDMFADLKLGMAQGNLFENPVFAKWVAFVEKRYKKDPTRAHTKIYKTLADYYKDDAARAEVLLQARKGNNLKPLAENLIDVMLSRWKLDGKPENDVFARLKHAQEDAELLKIFNTWVDNYKTEEALVKALVEAVEPKSLSQVEAVEPKSSSQVEAVETKSLSHAEKMLDIQFARWKLDGKTEDEVFALLKLDPKKGDIFKSPVFSRWVAYVKAGNEHPEVAHKKIFKTVEGHYTNEADLVKALVEAVETEGTRVLAEDLLDIQFATWKLDGKTEKDIFALLKLDPKKGDLFKSPVFSKWVAYVKARYEDPKVAHKKIFDILVGHYTNEADLVKALVEAVETEGTRPLAEDLLDIQFATWKLDGKTEKDIFALLKLDPKKGDLFKSPVFSKWVAYVETRYKTPKRAHKKMFETLAGHYKDDAALAKVLLEGTKIENMRPLAEQLIAIQLKRWKRAGKPENNVFARLKRALEDVDLLKTFEVLSGHYNEDDAALANVLLEETKIERTRPLAEKLIDVMLTRWKLDGKPENDVFALLKHNQEGAKLLKNFETLADYHENEAALVKALVEAIEIESSSHAEKLLDIQLKRWKLAGKPENDISELLTNVQKEVKLLKELKTLEDKHKTEAALVKALVEAVETKSSSDAEKLLDIQFARWKLAGKTEDEVFALLKLDPKKDDIFKSPVFSRWVAYVKAGNEHPEVAHKKIFKALVGHYKDEAALAEGIGAGTQIESTRVLAEELLDIQFKRWGVTTRASVIFALLKLRRKEGELFKSPVFSRWVAFVQAKHEDPEVANDIIFKTLAGHYTHEADLVEVLLEGTKSDSLALLAGQLLDIQFTKWVTTREDKVFALLKLGQEKGDLFKSLVFLKWVAFVETRYKKVDPKLAHEMIYVTLAGNYKDDAALAEVLLEGTKGNELKPLAEELKGMLERVQAGDDMDEIFPSVLKAHQKANDLEAKSVPSG